MSTSSRRVRRAWGKGLDGLPVALDEVGRNLPVRSCGVRLVGTRQVGHGQNLVGSGRARTTWGPARGARGTPGERQEALHLVGEGIGVEGGPGLGLVVGAPDPPARGDPGRTLWVSSSRTTTETCRLPPSSDTTIVLHYEVINRICDVDTVDGVPNGAHVSEVDYVETTSSDDREMVVSRRAPWPSPRPGLPSPVHEASPRHRPLVDRPAFRRRIRGNHRPRGKRHAAVRVRWRSARGSRPPRRCASPPHSQPASRVDRGQQNLPFGSKATARTWVSASQFKVRRGRGAGVAGIHHGANAWTRRPSFVPTGPRGWASGERTRPLYPGPRPVKRPPAGGTWCPARGRGAVALGDGEKPVATQPDSAREHVVPVLVLHRRVGRPNPLRPMGAAALGARRTTTRSRRHTPPQ